MEKTIEVLFPIEQLTPLPAGERPTAIHVRQLRKELIQCAMSVPTTLGGGAHGHLGLILPAAQYTALPGNPVAFQRPQQPAPFHIGGGTAAVVATQAAAHQRSVQEFTLCNKVDLSLKAMLLKAVPRIYLAVIADPTYEFANVTTAQMLAHIEANYGTINEDDLAANLENCEAAWDPNTPIESILANTNYCAQFAEAGGDVISDANKVRLTLKAVEKSGVLEDAITDWRKKPAADRTWANLPAHLIAYNKERTRKTTAAQAGFNAANAATQQQRSTSPTPQPGATVGGVKLYYCFTHGLGKNPDHTSLTCTNPCPEHKKEATVDNMMGGNNTIRRRRNERSVITRPMRNNNPTQS